MYNGSFDLSNESKPIRDIAYDRLKHAIITGELPAGSRIVETTYAEQLHISRTPLREALRKLERDGLVEYVLRRGVVVRAFTINDIEEIFTIRNAMMMLILPSVIKNVTDKDIAGENGLPTKTLHAAALCVTVAAVTRTAACFFMCHEGISLHFGLRLR